MMLDSFTSNWQDAIFTEYGTTSVQMMCAVNMFSCLFTATSLFQQSSFAYSIDFMMKVQVKLEKSNKKNLLLLNFNFKNTSFLALRVCYRLLVDLNLFSQRTTIHILHNIKIWTSNFCNHNDHKTGKFYKIILHLKMILFGMLMFVYFSFSGNRNNLIMHNLPPLYNCLRCARNYSRIRRCVPANLLQ